MMVGGKLRHSDVIMYVVVVLGGLLFTIATVVTVVCLAVRRHKLSPGFIVKQTSKLRSGLLTGDVSKTLVAMKSSSSSSTNSPLSPHHHHHHAIPPSTNEHYSSISFNSQHLSHSTNTPSHYEDLASIAADWLPSNTDAVTWATVTESGAHLALPHSAVSLTIAEDAIMPNMQHQYQLHPQQEMFIGVSRDDTDRPKLTGQQTMLSDIVVCGPASVCLSKPAVLSLPHCAHSVDHQWSLTVIYHPLRTNEITAMTDAWRPVWSDDTSASASSCFVHLTATCCYVMMTSLGRYALIGQPNHRTTPPATPPATCKRLRLAVFVPRVATSVDYSVRVYFVEDTLSAIQGVVDVEQQLGGTLVDCSRHILFHFNGGNLSLSVDHVGPGFRLKQTTSCQEIPFRHIWNGSQSGLHCSFTLEQTDPQSAQLTCDVIVSQTLLLGNRQVIPLVRDVTAPVIRPQGVAVVKSRGTWSHFEGPSSDRQLVSALHDRHLSPVKLSKVVRQQLTTLLGRQSRGRQAISDWSTLAIHLGFDCRHLSYFAGQPCPVSAVLDMWQVVESSTHINLVDVLRRMSIHDVADIVEQERDRSQHLRRQTSLNCNTTS